MQWIVTSVIWYFYLFVIGIVFLPITVRLFRSFFDLGYAFSKTIGLIVTTYALLVLGIFKLLPFSKEGIIFFLIILCIGNFKLFHTSFFKTLRSLSRSQWIIIVIEELLLLAGILFLTYVRGQQPAIRGLEKFMDFGFMQSILRTTYFPPLDMWLSGDTLSPQGYPINYYYFGHLSGALLTKLSGISAFVSYNLILATILGQGLSLGFSLASNLAHQIVFKLVKNISIRHLLVVVMIGFLGTFLINFAGNLHTVYLLTNGYENEHPEPFWEIFQSPREIQETMKRDSLSVPQAIVRNSSYWYPNATRFIPFTIHEFPSYSYVVADLHGHVFDIPFVLVTAGLGMLVLTKQKKKDKDKKKTVSVFNPIYAYLLKWFDRPLEAFGIAVGFGFMVAVHYMTNAFDGPIYLLFAGCVFLLLYRIHIRTIFVSVITFLSFLLFSLPFSLHFKPFASGIGVNCSPDFLTDLGSIGPFLFEKGNCQVSSFWMFFVLWGFFIIAFVLFIVSVYFGHQKNIQKTDRLIGLFFLFGIFLLLVPEFFYIKDIYPAHFRANTMFKMGYQAYLLMSIASAYTLLRLSFVKKKVISRIGIAVFLFLFIFVGVYPFFAFPSYYGIVENWKNPQLDGAIWMSYEIPQDKEIVDYFQKHVQGQPTILEAQGDSYTDYNRVSAYTGLPTVAGWWVHEWLWRGSSDVVGNRIPDIITIYESTDLDQTKVLLDSYDIQYVVISEMEREKYPNLNEEKFSLLGTKIFESQNGLGSIYQIF